MTLFTPADGALKVSATWPSQLCPCSVVGTWTSTLACEASVPSVVIAVLRALGLVLPDSDRERVPSL
ncbi:MAG: hypothetical protein M3020_00720 [Myxococcota bacterium]|nr:hypothetical protein [Myxococcota bacterium]